MKIDKKLFWENKIIGWEDIRYQRSEENFNFFESIVNRTNKTLIFRLETAFKSLLPYIKDKKVVELGCGSGFLSNEFIKMGASSYIGYDISEAAIKRAKEKSINTHKNKINFFANTITNLSTLDADYVFSLGLTDWLSDEELEHLFYITRNSHNLHSISENRFSISQILHKLYVHLSYGRKSQSYVPRYYKTKKIEDLMKKNSNKEVCIFRHKRLSFGTLISSFPIKI
jgi:SAM-dependent methyltransferase